jgi:DNA-binding transcriptional LysR family regulator
VDLTDLDRENFVGYSPYESRYFYDLVVSIFASLGVVPNYVQYMSQMHSILGLVRAGLGVSLVPEAAANLRMDGVVLRELDIDPSRIVELHLVWREPIANPAAQRLIRFVRSFAQTA